MGVGGSFFSQMKPLSSNEKKKEEKKKAFCDLWKQYQGETLTFSSSPTSVSG